MSEEEKSKPKEADSLRKRLSKWTIGEWAALFAIIGVIATIFYGAINLLPEPVPTPTVEPTTVSRVETIPLATLTSTPIPAAPVIAIRHIEYAPEEDPDCDHEFVSLVNNGEESLDMSYWTLSDSNENNEPFTFPEFILPPGAGVKVWTGKGENTATDLYWGCGRSIWNNNDKDTATLKDNEGNIVATRTYEP